MANSKTMQLMEPSSVVSKNWAFCCFASLLGFIVLAMCLSHQRPRVYLAALPEDLITTGLEYPALGGRKKKTSECDVFRGRWVYDPMSHPLYRASQCPFLSDQVRCQKNGRPDSEYEKWRWDANDCEIPRFNGTEMLERWRGKRIIIVGDSLNRNQWESLACLLYVAATPSRSYLSAQSSVHKIFRAEDYNCSVEFFWSPFLVQLEESTGKGRVLRLDTMSASAQSWRAADLMVFNSAHWWLHRGKLQAWDFLEYEGMRVDNITAERAYELGMKTWATWVDKNADPSNSTVIFRSISPEHKQWCYNQTAPIVDELSAQLYGSTLTTIIEKTLAEMKMPVKYLNITRLSFHRKDAHTSVYRVKQGNLLDEEQRKQPIMYADCSHWCLPGLPDTWNELIYAIHVLEIP
ncbi:xylan O-acetyltransferase 5-like [Aristolochia californica]|uniref:xylan O-acetyltransferase 5-like n=1 Tax=Aristolochia californica TaxID=171875 RepID=UPI0035DB4BEA